MSLLLDVFVLPFLSNIGLYTPRDATYGRYLMETSPYETALEVDPEVRVASRRVLFEKNGKGEEVLLNQKELESSKGKEWIYYKIWEKGSGTRCADVVMLHGINDYGGKWASHIPNLLDKRFRVIAPDLPSHGRSTGLHAYLTSPDQLSDALEAVLADLDTISDSKRKLFLVGSSMGGGAALSYCARHPGRRRIDGVFCIAPLIGVAPETLPPALVQKLARVVRFFAGRLPFAPAVRGKVSDDPRVEEEFNADPRGYHGWLRVSTGLTLLLGLSYLTPSVAASFQTPFRIIHGNHDRATSHLHSVQFYEAAGSEDKELEVYEGYEHVMLKVGIDEKDDEKRQRVLVDLETWLSKRI